MNKEKYEVPVMEIIVFESQDVIRTSNIGDWEGEVDPFTGFINFSM